MKEYDVCDWVREREREIEIEISGGVIKKCLHSSGLHLGNLVYK